MPIRASEIELEVKRQWLVVARRDAGKSTFFTRMETPILWIDADGKFRETLHLIKNGKIPGVVASDIIVVTADEIVADSKKSTPEKIRDLLDTWMPSQDGRSVKTIVVDTITPILAPLVAKAQADNDAGRNKNQSSAFKEKALQMKILFTAVNKWDTDVIWGAHIDDSQFNGKDVARMSITPAELGRLEKYLNARLRLEEKNGTYSAFVEMCGLRPELPKDAVAYSDPSGKLWYGMPEALEAAMYDIPKDEQVRIDNNAPELLPDGEAAVLWLVDQVDSNGERVFNHKKHAENTYKKVRLAVIEEYGEEWRKQGADMDTQKRVLTAALRAEIEQRIAEKNAIAEPEAPEVEVVPEPEALPE